jgi:AcrR family transcriptional regulator
MARPVTISNEHLLGTARAVFLEKGLHATTAEVAARAGVSEGILFKRYGSKAALFRAAMNVGDEVLCIERMLRAPADLPGGDARERLRALAERFVEIFRRIVPVTVMSLGQGDSLPPGMHGPNPPPLRTIRALAAYFDGERDAGRLRVRDAEVLARIFLGALWHFVFLAAMMPEGKDKLSEDRFLGNLVETLIEGVAPESSPPHRPRRTRSGADRTQRGARS